jgi:hypothetical protein
LGPWAGISSRDDLNFIKFREVNLVFFHLSSLSFMFNGGDFYRY